MEFYSLDNILKNKAHYNIIIGERSNGKTYACLKYGLEDYCKNGKQMAIIRRWQEDFKGKRGQQMFEALVANEEVKNLSGGKYNDIYYYGGRWYLSTFNSKGERLLDKKPFAYAFSLSTMEHDKSTSFPNINTIVFDEFLTRGQYIPDEFVIFMNVLSTIIRYRTNVKIFMLGNTVNKYCPYFEEMGLKHISEMEKGTIDVYQYGEEGKLKVAVEFADSISKEGKPSDVYFTFDNPKLNMITEGIWEVDIYPHCPIKYKPKNIVYTYFIKFGRDILQCEIIQCDDLLFTYIHRKTTELKNTDDDLIFTTDYSPRYNIRRDLLSPPDKLGRKIKDFFIDDKVFYQSNEIGEIVRNYILWCKSLA